MARLSLLRVTLLTTIVAIGLAVVFWVVWHNFPVTQTMALTVDFTKSTPMVSDLYPGQRVSVLDATAVTVTGSPVYFTIRPGSWWETVHFVIEYSGDAMITEMAGRTGEGWSFVVQQPDTVIDLGDGHRRLEFSFNLSGLYDQRNSHEFIINSDASEEQSFTIHSIRAYVSQ